MKTGTIMCKIVGHKFIRHTWAKYRDQKQYLVEKVDFCTRCGIERCCENPLSEIKKI